MPIAEPSIAFADAPAVDVGPSSVTAAVPTGIPSKSTDLVIDTALPEAGLPSAVSTAESPPALPSKCSDNVALSAESQIEPSVVSCAVNSALPIPVSSDASSNSVKSDVDLERVTVDRLTALISKSSENSVNSEKLQVKVPSASSPALNVTMPIACSAASPAGLELGNDSVYIQSTERPALPSGSSESRDKTVTMKIDGDAAISEIHDENEITHNLQETLLNDSGTQVNKDKKYGQTRFPLGDLVVEEIDLNDCLDTEAWKAEERHVFVLSSSGKPVYSRHGSEDRLVTLFGVMQALVSIVEDSDDRIESIHFGKNVIVFQIRGPIILVTVSKKNDSVLFCANQLTYVYNQIVSVLTLKQVTSIFERRRNYDLRRLLTGSERLIDHLLQFYETEPSIFMNGISCIPMPSAHREAISSTIISACSKIKNMVFAVLIANNKLISLARKRGYSMTPSDLHLILNMVAASESLKTAESWTPICLPNFNADGFLYAHVSYLSDDCPACLLLLTVDQGIFFRLSEAKTKITEKLAKNKSMALINEVLKAPPSLWLSLHDLGLSKIRQFIYKCRKTSNVVSSPLTAPYDTPQEANLLFTKYQKLYSTMIESNPQVHGLFQVSAEETVVCLLTDKFEILVAVEPLVKKQLALALITKLCQWVQSEEDRFFLSNVPYL